jgi:hypothetical protein
MKNAPSLRAPSRRRCARLQMSLNLNSPYRHRPITEASIAVLAHLAKGRLVSETQAKSNELCINFTSKKPCFALISNPPQVRSDR